MEVFADWRLYVLAVALVVLYWIIRELLRATQKPTAPACVHMWRSVAPPYSRQCRMCGAVEYQADPGGAFPEGLIDYYKYIDRLKPGERRVPPRPDICHCGASMAAVMDEKLGPIWQCDICKSWRQATQ